MLSPLVLKYLFFEIYHVCRFSAHMKELVAPEVPDELQRGLQTLATRYRLVVRPQGTPNLKLMFAAAPELPSTGNNPPRTVLEVYIGTRATDLVRYRLQLDPSVECRIHGVSRLREFPPMRNMYDWIDTFFYAKQKRLFALAEGEVLARFIAFTKKFYRGLFRDVEFAEWVEELVAEHGDFYILQSMKRKVLQMTTHDGRTAAVSRAKERLRDVAPFLDAFHRRTPKSEIRYLDVGASEGNITSAVVDYFGLTRQQSFACDLQPTLESRKFQYAQVVDQRHIPFFGRFNLVTMFMVNHHFTHWKDMVQSIKAKTDKQTTFIIREHDCTTETQRSFYDLVHTFYRCVVNTEMSVEDIVDNPPELYYYDSKFNWKKRFEAEGFIVVASKDTHDRMDSFYLVLRRR